jgi:hypothetical protein
MKLQHKPNTLWLEFGVANGTTINYISKFTTDKVYGFDSFEGLPEKWRDGFDKGAFNENGNLPKILFMDLIVLKDYQSFGIKIIQKEFIVSEVSLHKGLYTGTTMITQVCTTKDQL